MFRNVMLGAVCVGLCSMTLMADTLKLKDGTSVSGRVIDQGEKYWIKTADGSSKMIDKDLVQTWIAGDVGTPAAGAAGGGAAAIPDGAGFGFAQMKAKADRAESAFQAVGIWQSYIDSKPAAADLASAKEQLATWQKILKGDGEKINGKWIWGEDREKLLAQVRQIVKEAEEADTNHQTLVSIHKYEEAVKLYPNNFDAQFYLGYLNLIQGAEAGKVQGAAKIDASIKALEVASKINVDSAAAWSDLAVAYHFRGKWQQSIDTAYKAVKLEDNKETVQNLVNTISYAPAGIQRSSGVKKVMDDARLLASKYNIGERGEWAWVLPDKEEKEKVKDDGDGEEKGRPGLLGTGSGEFISADGYILTNRHVAKEGDYILVRTSDNIFRLAKRIVIDDEQDMAVIKINPAGAKMPYVKLAAYDHPPIGAEVSVFGYPLVGLAAGFTSSVKMTRGIVTAWDEDQAMCDVTVDAAVNPGNSGGCMIDKHGDLMALTTAKTFAGTMGHNAAISSYGEGQSTGRLRKFFKKQKDKLLPFKPTDADPNEPVLGGEDLAAKLTPIAVSIFMCNGTPPPDDGPTELPETAEKKRK